MSSITTEITGPYILHIPIKLILRGTKTSDIPPLCALLGLAYLVVLEELEDGEDDVIDIAEPGGLALLGVVESAGPVDGDVVAVVELDGAANGSPRVGLAEAVEAVEDGAVLADIEALERADLVLLRLGGDGAEEGDVVVGVEAAEVAVAGRVRPEYLHLVEEAVVGEQRMRHADAVRLHRVPLPVVVVAHLRVVEVADAPLRPIRAGGRQGVAAAAGRGVHHRRGGAVFFSPQALGVVLLSGARRRRRLSWDCSTRVFIKIIEIHCGSPKEIGAGKRETSMQVARRQLKKKGKINEEAIGWLAAAADAQNAATEAGWRRVTSSCYSTEAIEFFFLVEDVRRGGLLLHLGQRRDGDLDRLGGGSGRGLRDGGRRRRPPRPGAPGWGRGEGGGATATSTSIGSSGLGAQSAAATGALTGGGVVGGGEALALVAAGAGYARRAAPTCGHSARDASHGDLRRENDERGGGLLGGDAMPGVVAWGAGQLARWGGHGEVARIRGSPIAVEVWHDSIYMITYKYKSKSTISLKCTMWPLHGHQK
ncbi:hypothetical protein EJB05_41378, partial [Eragrostis curvula]